MFFIILLLLSQVLAKSARAVLFARTGHGAGVQAMLLRASHKLALRTLMRTNEVLFYCARLERLEQLKGRFCISKRSASKHDITFQLRLE